jgi:hypothetical protein
MAHDGRRWQVSLCDEKIISNLISDNLSDVPDDIFSESESDTEGGSDRKRVNVPNEENSKVDEKGCFVAYKLCPFQFIFSL